MEKEKKKKKKKKKGGKEGDDIPDEALTSKALISGILKPYRGAPEAGSC